jgi:hypothetical protein
MTLLNNLTLSQDAEGRVDWRCEVARDSASRDLLGPQETNTMRNGSCSIGRGLNSACSEYTLFRQVHPSCL